MLLPHPPTFQEAILRCLEGPNEDEMAEVEERVGYGGWRGEGERGRGEFEAGALLGEEVPYNGAVAELGLDAQGGGVVEALGLLAYHVAWRRGERSRPTARCPIPGDQPGRTAVV